MTRTAIIIIGMHQKTPRKHFFLLLKARLIFLRKKGTSANFFRPQKSGGKAVRRWFQPLVQTFSHVCSGGAGALTIITVRISAASGTEASERWAKLYRRAESAWDRLRCVMTAERRDECQSNNHHDIIIMTIL